MSAEPCVHGSASCARCVDEFLVRVFRTLRDRGDVDLSLERIAGEIDGLEPRQAEAMRLYYLGPVGATHEEVAALMSPPVGRVAVTRLLQRGKRSLLARLTR